MSEANVSDVLFLGFYSDQRGFVLKRSAAPSPRSGTGQRSRLACFFAALRPPTFHGTLRLVFYSRITLNLGGRRTVDGGPDNASCRRQPCVH
ncbi:hypothetical protein [Mesotoga sp. BH458_6_3_2_1]|uniref:hypothetical protein n=1 Tax=Mesotoga sp. BH458_6_3_2_1 TaxID=1437446 RepID=UPI0015FF676C|nr:hypothetical protein [Mesotoga sp. BH458_6_3_2_1]